MKWGVVVFPGSNCDKDCYDVLNDVCHQEVDFIWHKESGQEIAGLDAVVLPGGFSYGDYLRVGAMAKFSPVMKEVVTFANKGGLVLGICNGFQILIEAGLLPGALLRNESLKYICESVPLKVASNKNPFTKCFEDQESLSLPIAHMVGNYYTDRDGLKRLQDQDQIAFQYTKNPNGSVADIAGITNENGNVLGMMPHPERRAELVLGGDVGKRLFESAIASLA